MASTAQRPASGGPPGDASDDLKAIEPLFSRVTPPLPPVQFTGSTGVSYNMAGGQPDPTSLPRQVLTEIVARLLASDEGQGALMYGDASGYLGLREAIADKLRRWEHLEVAPDELCGKHGFSVSFSGKCGIREQRSRAAFEAAFVSSVGVLEYWAKGSVQISTWEWITSNRSA